jgi:hypothetical protein
MNDSDLTDFFDACYDDTTGYLHIAVGESPRWVDDKYGHEHWTQTHFAYPAERDRAVREIARAVAGGDVYICPNLMHANKRAQGAAVARMVVHSDLDEGRYDPEKVKAVGGFAVASGTPGNAHVYVPLTESVSADVHRELCRGLSRYLGAGDPKIADNDLLRPPGTFNHKAAARGGELASVQLLISPNGRVAPAVAAELFGIDPAASSEHRRAHTEHSGAPVNLDRYPSVRQAIERRTKDRSADTYRVVAVCHRVGLTLGETTWTVRYRDDLKERLDERGDDDLLAIWLKLDDEARTGRRVEPPSAPVADGAELLDDIQDTLTKFVVFPSEAAAVGATLWTVATHGLPAWQHGTRLVIKSPQKRCGKSRLLDLARLLCFRPLMSTDLSTAAIYRSLGDDDRDTPTLLIDEADALFGTKTKAEQNEDLRGLLNAGFQRDRPVMRCVGPNQEPTEFNTFSMCALAAIKALPDTIVDRAVVIDLKRRRSGETVTRFRIRRDTSPLLELRARLTAWVREGERLTELADAEPEMPESIEDRAQDAWEPLIAIADAAGGDWPELARTACVDLCGAADVVDDDDIQLLTDINIIFAASTEPFLRSSQLVRELKERDESSWRDDDLTPHKLAKMLRPFDVRPRYGPGGSVRGYWRDDFADTFSRYNCGNCGTAE